MSDFDPGQIRFYRKLGSIEAALVYGTPNRNDDIGLYK